MRVVMISVLAACSYNPSGLGPDADGTTSSDTNSEGPFDAPLTGVDVAAGCFGTLVPVCPPMPPSGAVSLSGTVNTDSDSRCQTTGLALGACVIGGTSIDVATTTVSGSLPLVLVATDTLTVTGTLDLSSRRNGAQNGAGSNTGTCNSGIEPATRGGGQGGSLGATGGFGGNGNAVANSGGDPAAVVPFTTLRGGCSGATGNGGLNGLGGQGGGAVALIATTINVDGSVNASGASGTFGEEPPVTGGGGGGSGGMIVLDATNLTIAGSVFANGGGGGGASGGSSDASNNATEPTASSPGTGGSGAGGGGNGGSGSSGAAGVNGGNGNASGGGGGGGGGAGIIKARPGQTSPNASPPLS